jgi:uncharacterized membrane protein YgdD (TMEM256/DUF423 family)
MNKTPTLIVVASILGLLAVAAGAFGAHALKGRLDPAQLAAYETAVRYQMFHALALIGVAWVGSISPSRLAAASGMCMVIGVVLFSGSIYGLTLLEWKWLGPVTPLGGLAMIVGWLLLTVAGARIRCPGP